MVNIVLADDHSIVRNGLKTLLENQADLHIAAECQNAADVITFAEQGHHIDIVITDMNMPEMDGLELVKALKVQYPEIKVVILSMYDDLKYVTESYRAGAWAYMMKTVDLAELLFALGRVQQGIKYICSELAQKLLAAISANLSTKETFSQEHDFSSRELEVLKLIADGLTNYEMSEKLFLSRRTVEGHRQSLLEKTGSRNTAALIRYAVRAGLVQ